MAYNGFNYFLSVKKNDIVSLIYKRNPFSIIKKDGVVGLIETNYLGDIRYAK